MSRPVSYTSAVTVDITSFSGSTNLTVGTGTSAATYAVNSSANTTNLAAFSSTTRNSSGYAYYKFDVSEIPNIASITSVSCTFRAACRYGTGTGRTDVQLMAGTTLKGSAQNVNATGRSGSSAITISDTGTWTRSELDNIALRIYSVKTANSNGSHGTRFYGATLTVNYSVNGTEYEVRISNSTATITEPTGTTYVFQGDGQEILFYNVSDPNNITVKDNGTDVILTPHYEVTLNLVPSSLIESNGTVVNSGNALTNADSTTYAQISGKSQYYMVFGFDVSSIPQNAEIISVECVVKAEHTRTGTTYYTTAQLYAGSTAKGTQSTFGSPAMTVNLTTGTWTRSELSNIRIRIGSTYNGGTNTYQTRFYGASLTIVYNVSGGGGTAAYYSYTVSNISADHTIVISDVSSDKMYIKTNTGWTELQKVYKKVSNSWVEQTDLTNVFTDGTIYVKG